MLEKEWRCQPRMVPLGKAAGICKPFVYLLLVYVAFRPAPETITPTGSAAGQKLSKKRCCVQTQQP